MPGRVSRKLLSAIMDCIRHNVRRTPSSIVWQAGWNCLESVCLRHTHNFNHAIEVNLLGCMVAIRIAAPRTTVLARMYRMIDGLSVSTRAVHAYRKFRTLPVASMELEFYGPQESRILKTFDYHDTVVAEAETSWEHVATCCNAAVRARGSHGVGCDLFSVPDGWRTVGRPASLYMWRSSILLFSVSTCALGRRYA